MNGGEGGMPTLPDPRESFSQYLEAVSCRVEDDLSSRRSWEDENPKQQHQEKASCVEVSTGHDAPQHRQATSQEDLMEKEVELQECANFQVQTCVPLL